MKTLFLTFVLAFTVALSFAQDRANHNTTRSNKTQPVSNEIIIGDTDASLFQKKKCIKAGGTFYEYPNGNKICVPARDASLRASITNGKPIQRASDKKKCLRSGGVWATNSGGSFCYKRLERSN
jgi:hypothetical protein